MLNETRDTPIRSEHTSCSLTEYTSTIFVQERRRLMKSPLANTLSTGRSIGVRHRAWYSMLAICLNHLRFIVSCEDESSSLLSSLYLIRRAGLESGRATTRYTEIVPRNSKKKANKTCMATPTSPSVFHVSTKFQPQPCDHRWLPLVGVPSL